MWPVKIVLMIVVIIGLVWEMAAPGLGLPGAIGVAALLILIGAPALTGMAQWWDILFICLGILFIAGEIFVIPGFGIAGISGTILLCIALNTEVAGAGPLLSPVSMRTSLLNMGSDPMCFESI